MLAGNQRGERGERGADGEEEGEVGTEAEGTLGEDRRRLMDKRPNLVGAVGLLLC